MTALLLIAVVVLVLINAFFVIAEYSLVRSRRPKLEAAKEEGLRGAALALEQIDHINEYISACQVGITLTSIGIGALGEPSIANLLEPVLGGPLAHGAAVAISVIVAYLLITSVHITIGELVPKLYAIEHAERLVRLVARPLRVSRLVFAPFITGLTFISNRILRLLGVDPDTINEQAENPEELKLIITESLQGGQLDPGEAGMLAASSTCTSRRRAR